MKTIIKFLKDELNKQQTAEHINVEKQDIDKVKSLFAGQNIQIRHSSKKGIKPLANQVWTIKDEYFDFLGYKQISSHPILVSLLTDIDSFEEEDFLRASVISPFVEMATQQDDVCNDASILGFPFLLENWNEQPILTEILDEYIGYYEPEEITDKEENLSSVQRQFREIEISRAKFLNNSISALIGFVEQNQGNEFGVVISVNGQIFFGGCPKADDKFVNNEPTIIRLNTEDKVLSKSGVIKKSRSISFINELLPFEIQIKKNEDGFIISILTANEIRLLDSNNKQINSFSNEEKSVFSALKKGLYTLESKRIVESIKIRLK